METALHQIEAWRAAGLDLSVSVNVDALQFEQDDFVAKLRELLARHPGVRHGDLELEVLETSALENIGHLSESMLRCREMGVEFALDDFGTGYSSLTYLKRLPANLLKIDQSFVRDMLDDPEDLAIIEGVLSLAMAFRRQTIAEGVETRAHGEILLRMGCVLGQGYAIARPMPAPAVAEWISTWQPEPSWAKCVTVNRDEMPLLFAEADHRAWVLQLGKHLRDERSAPPMEAQQCRFGQWLATIGNTRLADHPAREKIVVLHERVHRHGMELLNLKKRGFTGLALERMGEIEALRDELVAQLHRLHER
jgi:EAL domain-containing protein (putative c-di-GMP-specific phosphodiesterase class I)